MALILTILAVLIVLLASELWWRSQNVHDEFSRKFVHITVGSFVAFWPFYLSWGEIQLLSVAFFIAVALSKYLNVFRAIHSVQRPTWGELFFAIAVGAIAVITHDKYIYAAALLQMSLADGFAAVVGTRFGKLHQYYVFGHAKSLVGTATFWIISLAILTVYAMQPGVVISPLQVLSISVAATIIENIGIRGFDNLLAPVLVAVLLNQV